jgi:ABC-2 type transport system permease protein
MDALFLGKLFAMLAVSIVGIAVWGAGYGVMVLAGLRSIPLLAAPAVGWPLFLVLGFLYFAMAYLLLGAMFLAIGGMANTVREVQTLSMPATMLQLIVFFFASLRLPVRHVARTRGRNLSGQFALRHAGPGGAGTGAVAASRRWLAGVVGAVIVRGGAAVPPDVMKSGPAPRRRRASAA